MPRSHRCVRELQLPERGRAGSVARFHPRGDIQLRRADPGFCVVSDDGPANSRDRHDFARDLVRPRIRAGQPHRLGGEYLQRRCRRDRQQRARGSGGNTCGGGRHTTEAGYQGRRGGAGPAALATFRSRRTDTLASRSSGGPCDPTTLQRNPSFIDGRGSVDCRAEACRARFQRHNRAGIRISRRTVAQFESGRCAGGPEWGGRRPHARRAEESTGWLARCGRSARWLLALVDHHPHRRRSAHDRESEPGTCADKRRLSALLKSSSASLAATRNGKTLRPPRATASPPLQSTRQDRPASTGASGSRQRARARRPPACCSRSPSRPEYGRRARVTTPAAAE